jgi:hypothetical protein
MMNMAVMVSDFFHPLNRFEEQGENHDACSDE